MTSDFYILRYEYKDDLSKAPNCKEDVNYTPSCGHKVKIQCQKKQKYERNEVSFNCIQRIDVLLPRCGHEAKVSCDQANQLENWQGERCTPGKSRRNSLNLAFHRMLFMLVS